MAATILSSLIVLLQLMCVIIVAAYLLTRSRFFPEVLEGRLSFKVQVILIIFFGALSVYGTVAGFEVNGAIINVRDLGPMLAGLLGGPVVGVGAGLIGAIHRMSLGGFTVYSCSLATVLAGLFGGLIWLARKRKFAGITIAVIFAIAMEAFHMLLTVAICTPFEKAVAVVELVSIPMIAANAAGIFVFAFIIENLKTERRMQAERDTLVKEIQRKDTELSIAAEIQQSFLPEAMIPLNGFDIAGRNVMAKEVGGDFFDVIPLEVIPISQHRLGLMIADVSGKGIPAALFMALSRIVVRVNGSWYPDQPAEAIRRANTIISADSKSGMFVTLFYATLNAENRVLTYVNAGHNPPLLSHADGSFEELEATGMAMGALKEAVYTEGRKILERGDILVMYTDGITEAENNRQEMFGEARLRDAIARSRGMDSKTMMAKILDEVRAFSGDHPQSDDITLMIIRTE
ncbi:MAG TPA: SpoIIE family protein phosphatase [Methanoregula sp.]|nr:SpoIIE family protein phosphatase [Methanoregula sp.]